MGGGGGIVQIPVYWEYYSVVYTVTSTLSPAYQLEGWGKFCWCLVTQHMVWPDSEQWTLNSEHNVYDSEHWQFALTKLGNAQMTFTVNSE